MLRLQPWHWIMVAVAVLVIVSLLSLVVGPSFLRRRHTVDRGRGLARSASLQPRPATMRARRVAS